MELIVKKAKTVYIALDVEATGMRLGLDGTLSIGACVVTKRKLSFRTRQKQGLVFYAEIKPRTNGYRFDAMRIGCSHLICLEKLRRKDRRYDPSHPRFVPWIVIDHMREVCEDPRSAVERFEAWVRSVSGGMTVEGVVDTVFFDSGHINLSFGLNSDNPSPFGYAGLDLDSLYRGYTKRADADLRELGIVDNRTKPHRADHDAAFLADIARVLLFEKMEW